MNVYVNDILKYLTSTVSDFDMSISIEKTKIMSFSGKDPVRSKICISNNKSTHSTI
jgi:hypothetical protein